MRSCLLLVAAFVSSTVIAGEPLLRTGDPLLRTGDRVAILGGTFVERMQIGGHLEAELQCRRPDWKLSVRNIGWSGDDVHGIARKRFDGPASGFARLVQDVETADPTVVLVVYGFSEATDGPDAVERFQPGLTKLIAAIKSDDRRVILVPPVAMPGVRVTGYAQTMQTCRAIVDRVAKKADTPVLSLDWAPNLVQSSTDETTADGLLPSDAGYAALASVLAPQLVGGTPCNTNTDQLRTLISRKNELFFHRYRPQNETYLLLFRKHEQGNNAIEIPQFDPLIEQADREIWSTQTSR